IAALRQKIGSKFDRLDVDGRAALATAFLEGSVTNARMQELVPDHPTDITKMLRGLVGEGFLEAENQGRWTRYTLAPRLIQAPSVAHTLAHALGSINVATLADDEFVSLLDQVRQQPRSNRRLLEAVILRLCRDTYRSTKELADLMGRKSARRI